jgi:O-antigen/teichoic acid export membrane protein
MVEIVALVVYGMAMLEAQLLLNGLYAYGHFAHAALCDAGANIVSLGATLALATTGTTHVAPYVAALAVGPLGQIALSLSVLHRKGHGVRPRYTPLTWTQLLRTGVPGLGLSLGQSATYRLDRYLIGFYLTPAAVGLYSVAATCTEVVRLPSFSLGQVLFHRLAAMRLSVHKARFLYRTGVGVTAVLAFVLFLVCPWAIGTVFGHAYEGAVTPLRVLVLGEVAVASYLLDSSSLSGRNQMAQAAKATLLGLFVVTGLDLALIPSFGIVGAAWASVVGYSGMALFVRYRVVRLERAANAESRPRTEPSEYATD